MYFSPLCLAGCRDPRWTRYHSTGDLSLAACGISMHHLLHLQILPKQKEKAQPTYNLKVCVCLSLYLYSIHLWESTMVGFWCHTYQIMLPFFPFFLANFWDKCLFSTGYSIGNKWQGGRSLDNCRVHAVYGFAFWQKNITPFSSSYSQVWATSWGC